MAGHLRRVGSQAQDLFSKNQIKMRTSMICGQDRTFAGASRTAEKWPTKTAVGHRKLPSNDLRRLVRHFQQHKLRGRTAHNLYHNNGDGNLLAT